MKLNSKGFTLIELVIGMAVSTILITAISSFLIFNVHVFHRADRQVNVQMNVEDISEQVALLVREASSVRSVVAGGVTTYCFDFPVSRQPVRQCLQYNTTTAQLDILSGNEMSIRARNFERVTAFSIVSGVANVALENSRLVRIDITGTNNETTQTFSTQIALRNKGDVE